MPVRGQHDAPDALWVGLMGKKVNWVPWLVASQTDPSSSSASPNTLINRRSCSAKPNWSVRR